MIIHDISLPISKSLPIWPGDQGVNLELVEKIKEGSLANVSRLEMGVHTGTHIDAPYHFLGDGAPTIDRLPLEKLIGPAFVLEFSDEVDLVTAQLLIKASIPDSFSRLLIRTRNSKLWRQNVPEFNEDFVAISADGAQFLVDRQIQVIGVGYLSVAPYSDVVPTHQILLKANIVIIEGLNLSTVEAGAYSLFCLPLNIIGADGAPARVILTNP